ncbi:DUF1707 SHOCT-like domain-containing protein [Nocardioides pinisoli]|uniref:DUF1707 domain-containing protein n=1 Tax=Nocardioides pinisoli TaxID=2950279 RepID=A0ABT1L088_9ACTN|nr:DUF1707 domain-containing protein [Nocardioides pinisoli]MCP3423297.1 DUF1707 domain-containing protein [Nocardioides pinisoli]
MSVPEGAAPSPGHEAVRRIFAARERAEAARDARLASDSERERVCELLGSAFADGRLTAAELNERTTAALAARTHGDLNRVVRGLGAMGHPALWAATPDRPSRMPHRVAFWLVGFVTFPFVFFGTMLLVFGSDAGDRVAGTVMLVLFLPGLLALYRWAHPTT